MAVGAKVLIIGEPNTGKTTLLKTLENALVISRDGKPCSLEGVISANVDNYESMSDLIDFIYSKFEVYTQKFGTPPATIAFDSVSRIFTDCENNCTKRFSNYDIWTNINKEIRDFTDILYELQMSGINVIIVSHATYDAESKKLIETSKGNFGKNGGFLSYVDYAIHIHRVGTKRIVNHRNTHLSRTFLDDYPDKQDTSEFNLQDYISKIQQRATNISEQWNI